MVYFVEEEIAVAVSVVESKVSSWVVVPFPWVCMMLARILGSSNGNIHPNHRGSSVVWSAGYGTVQIYHSRQLRKSIAGLPR